MSANALSAQGATLTIGTSAAAKTITAITKANPAVVTSTAHGLADGTVVTLRNQVGIDPGSDPDTAVLAMLLTA